MSLNNKIGFTLAEVLITLGVIGIVAAMTIPTLFSKINGLKYRSQFKKSIATLNQAVRLNVANHDFDFAGTDIKCNLATGALETSDNTMSFCSIFNSSLSGHHFAGEVRNIKMRKNNSSDTYNIPTVNSSYTNGIIPPAYLGWAAYILSDGTIIAFNQRAASCTLPIGVKLSADWINKHNECMGFIDVNGVTLPNKEVKCSTTNKATQNPDKPCIVKNDSVHLTDVYPVMFYNDTVTPASDAAAYILRTAK